MPTGGLAVLETTLSKVHHALSSVLNETVYPLPHYALYWEAFVATWILVQVLTGKLIYRSSVNNGVRVQRADDPKTFWIGITVQFLPLAGCFCASVNFALGMYLVAFLSVLIVVVTAIHFTWVGLRCIIRHLALMLTYINGKTHE